MSTFIARATNVVKENYDNDHCQPWHILSVKTLAERARWVMQHRGLGQREWCERAKVSHGYLSAFFVRAAKDAGPRGFAPRSIFVGGVLIRTLALSN